MIHDFYWEMNDLVYLFLEECMRRRQWWYEEVEYTRVCVCVCMGVFANSYHDIYSMCVYDDTSIYKQRRDKSLI